MKKILYCIYVLLLSFSLITCNNREEKLIKKGNDLVSKIELYRKNKGILPATLSEIGIEEKEEGPLYYQTKDSINYMVWFGTSEGESKTYYSDSKKWEDHQR